MCSSPAKLPTEGCVCVSFTSKNMLCAEQPGSAWPSGNLLELTGHISILTSAYVPYTTQSCCLSPGRERGLKHEGDIKLAPSCWRWPRDSIACPKQPSGFILLACSKQEPALIEASGTFIQESHFIKITFKPLYLACIYKYRSSTVKEKKT